MSILLSIVASPRGEYSVSSALAAQFVATYTANHPGTTVVTRDLTTSKLSFVDLPWIAGAYTPAEQHSPEMAQALALSNELVDELAAADHIVIGTPMYNFATPAILKAWIDQIVRIGRTFNASYEGLLKGKKATIIIASMGVYAPGSPMESYNVEASYLKQVLGFIGISDVTFVYAGGTGGVNSGQITFADLIAQFTGEVDAAAA